MTTTILVGDVRDRLRDITPGSVQLCVTSPPYWGLRSYLAADDPRKASEIGAEPTPDAFVATLVEVFGLVWHVLRDDGVLVVNLADSYANNPSTSDIPRAEQGNGSGVFLVPAEEHSQARRQEPNRLTAMKHAGLKKKDLALVPARFALAMQAAGWTVRSVMPWVKANCMPESVGDRPTTAHEWIMLFAKGPRYYWDATAIRRDHVRLWDAEKNGGSMATTRHHDAHIGGTNRHTRPYPEPNPAGRNFRTSDIFHAALDDAIAAARSHLAALEAVRDRGGLWTDGDDALALLVNPTPSSIKHYAMFPERLVEPFVKAASRPGDTVLDCFSGTGTTGRVAVKHGRDYIGIDLDPRAEDHADVRLNGVQMAMNV